MGCASSVERIGIDTTVAAAKATLISKESRQQSDDENGEWTHYDVEYSFCIPVYNDQAEATGDEAEMTRHQYSYSARSLDGPDSMQCWWNAAKTVGDVFNVTYERPVPHTPAKKNETFQDVCEATARRTVKLVGHSWQGGGL